MGGWVVGSDRVNYTLLCVNKKWMKGDWFVWMMDEWYGTVWCDGGVGSWYWYIVEVLCCNRVGEI